MALASSCLLQYGATARLKYICKPNFFLFSSSFFLAGRHALHSWYRPTASVLHETRTGLSIKVVGCSRKYESSGTNESRGHNPLLEAYYSGTMNPVKQWSTFQARWGTWQLDLDHNFRMMCIRRWYVLALKISMAPILIFTAPILSIAYQCSALTSEKECISLLYMHSVCRKERLPYLHRIYSMRLVAFHITFNNLNGF